MNTNEPNLSYIFIGFLIFGAMIVLACLKIRCQKRQELARLSAELDVQLGNEIRETTAYIYSRKSICPLARAQMHGATEHFNAARRLGQQGGSDKEIVALLNLGLNEVSKANTSTALYLLQRKTPGRLAPSLQDLARWNSEPHEYAVLTSASGLEADFKYAGGTAEVPPTKLLTLAQALAVGAQFEVGRMLNDGDNSPARARIINVRTGRSESVFAPSGN